MFKVYVEENDVNISLNLYEDDIVVDSAALFELARSSEIYKSCLKSKGTK